MEDKSARESLRQIPAVDAVLQIGPVREALASFPRKLVVEAVRQVLDEIRKKIMSGAETEKKARRGGKVSIQKAVDEKPLAPRSRAGADESAIAAMVVERIDILSRFTLRRVINATGIVIHTNLGRSTLPEQAVERLAMICRGYSNLEYDLDRGERGSRYVHAEAILRELTGAEAALVVNNNAGAVFLALNSLAAGREVVVSRGQLVEIGGSFRIPDVMSASGAILREVGATNRTHLEDYTSAITEHTGLIMKVHASNYRIIGFTAEVSLEDLVRLGRERGIPAIKDLGSGCFIDLAQFGLHGETTVQDSVRAGADLVTFSGDKLLGGPQAGIMVGRKDLIEKCRKNPITRALRVDKMTLAALETTLRFYRDEKQAIENIPTLRMIAASTEEIEKRAQELARRISAVSGATALEIAVRQGFSQVGGGSLPAQDLPTFLVSVRSENFSANRIEQHLRQSDPPVIGRIESDCFLMDARTIADSELEPVQRAFQMLVAKGQAKRKPA